jgi:hypothetical protein
MNNHPEMSSNQIAKINAPSDFRFRKPKIAKLIKNIMINRETTRYRKNKNWDMPPLELN